MLVTEVSVSCFFRRRRTCVLCPVLEVNPGPERTINTGKRWGRRRGGRATVPLRGLSFLVQKIKKECREEEWDETQIFSRLVRHPLQTF